jgi:hypothetical protein
MAKDQAAGKGALAGITEADLILLGPVDLLPDLGDVEAQRLECFGGFDVEVVLPESLALG